ncbi:heme exporter protein CcmD [Comamonas terrigena]|jgi:heme exporter protein CcmD|nr:heme exporter protein CcmD [Comamonas terrigena]MDH1290920.1 heme exporter protein CcmD [Comamonas terrigena]
MQDHAFFIALAYGVSAMLLVTEVWSLWRRCRRQAAHTEGELPE